jgi:HSP20 family protein
MSHIKLVQKDSIASEVEHMQQLIARRAHELFEQRGSFPGSPWADWFAAERELVRRPAIELREERGAYVLSASLAGVDPAAVRIEVAPQDVVIEAEPWTAADLHDAGRVLQSEFRAVRVFRSVHLPSTIDAKKTQAEYRDGVLTIMAPIMPRVQPMRRDARVA